MMRALLLFLLIAVGPGAAVAQSLHDVTGVSADDVLNVRSAPTIRSNKIGSLAADAQDIEVTAMDNGWGRINLGETAGWVSLRFLAQQPAGDYALAQTLQCFGTEPFWNLSLTQGQTARFEALGLEAGEQAVGLLQASANRPDRFWLQGSNGAIAVIRRAECNDGMSDRLFALEIDLHLPSDVFVSGCCSIAP